MRKHTLILWIVQTWLKICSKKTWFLMPKNQICRPSSAFTSQSLRKSACAPELNSLSLEASSTINNLWQAALYSHQWGRLKSLTGVEMAFLTLKKLKARQRDNNQRMSLLTLQYSTKANKFCLRIDIWKTKHQQRWAMPWLAKKRSLIVKSKACFNRPLRWKGPKSSSTRRTLIKRISNN